MVRFLRNLILFCLALLVAAYLGAWYFSGWVVNRMQGPLTARLVRVFGTDEDARYGYEAGLRFWPPRVEVRDIEIDADSLRLGEDELLDAIMGIDRVTCELLPLIRKEDVVIREVSGRRLSGRLTNAAIADHIERANQGVSDVDVSEHGGNCWIRGHFGLVSVTMITIIGRWAVDDRQVVTLVDREYRNADGSFVPDGAVQIIEENIGIDVRLTVLDEELVGERAEYDGSGLTVTLVEQ